MMVDDLLFQKDFSPSFWHTAFQQNSLREPASRSFFFPCLSSLGQVERMLRFDTVDESFAEDLNQCRCDSIGRSANNVTERQADDNSHITSELIPAPLWAQSSALNSDCLLHISNPVLSMPSKLGCNCPSNCTSTTHQWPALPF